MELPGLSSKLPAQAKGSGKLFQQFFRAATEAAVKQAEVSFISRILSVLLARYVFTVVFCCGK